MKWLFAALVALNIIVFGGMITHRLNKHKRTHPNKGNRNISRGKCLTSMDKHPHKMTERRFRKQFKINKK